MTDDLITWLRAALDADEGSVEARIAAVIRELPVTRDEVLAGNIRLRRALAEVDAKRRIVSLHRCDDERAPDPICNVCLYEPPCETLRALALPYADREGYREEWKP